VNKMRGEKNFKAPHTCQKEEKKKKEKEKRE
jgi:hypothetical protein